MTTTTTFAATVSASDGPDALRRVGEACGKCGLTGFEPTGRVAVRSERHNLWTVEVANHGGNVNDAWVVLTSYGVSPDKTLGSMWEDVPGVGA